MHPRQILPVQMPPCESERMGNSLASWLNAAVFRGWVSSRWQWGRESSVGGFEICGINKNATLKLPDTDRAFRGGVPTGFGSDKN
jgi:hypothetical protein